MEFFPPLARTMLARRLPECLLILLTAPSTSIELGIFAAIRDLLLLFLATQEGEAIFKLEEVMSWCRSINKHSLVICLVFGIDYQ